MKKIATIIGYFLLSSMAFAETGDWNNAWLEESEAAKVRCAELFDAFQMQAVCVDNERDGYNKMQGDFGLPSNLVDAAKTRCAEIFDAFQMQAVCMQKEKKGYDALQD